MNRIFKVLVFGFATTSLIAFSLEVFANNLKVLRDVATEMAHGGDGEPVYAPVSSRSGKRRAQSSGRHAMKGEASNYWQEQATGCPPYGRFNPNAMTAAHKTLPCGTKVRVYNPRTKKSVVVVINDRGPYYGGRVIDLSRASYGKIASHAKGHEYVELTVVPKETALGPVTGDVAQAITPPERRERPRRR